MGAVRLNKSDLQHTFEAFALENRLQYERRTFMENGHEWLVVKIERGDNRSYPRYACRCITKIGNWQRKSPEELAALFECDDLLD